MPDKTIDLITKFIIWKVELLPYSKTWKPFAACVREKASCWIALTQIHDQVLIPEVYQYIDWHIRIPKSVDAVSRRKIGTALNC